MKVDGTDLSIALLALVMIAGGLSIMISGQMRNLVLGDERYLVGGTLAVFGIYSAVLGIRRWKARK